MARYIADQNAVAGIHESGLYAAEMAGSSFWIGLVTESSIDDAENLIETDFLGTASRNYGVLDQGPQDVTGNFVYHPQDMTLVFMAIGSVHSVSGTTTGIHTATEIDTDAIQSAFTSGALNPPMSFTLEDSKQAPGTGQNFIRTVRGVVPDTVTLSATQQERVSVSVDWIGQGLTYSSGATTTVVEQENRSYLWNDFDFQMGGSSVDTAKAIEFEISNNREGPHYLNGSRVIADPLNGKREYMVAVTLDWDNVLNKRFYEEYYKGGSEFNCQLDLNADGVPSSVGSQHATFFMSGCKILSIDVPSPADGVTESTMEIRVQSVNAQEFNFNMSGGQITPF